MKKEKVVLLYPALIDAQGINTATIEPSLGLVYIATILQRDEIPVQIIDANISRLSHPEVVKAIGTKPPLIIGLTANILTYQSALTLARYLRIQFPDSLIVFGGPHPSSIPREALGEKCVDIVVIGEGENTVLELVQTLKNGESLEKVDGIAFKSHGRMIFNKSRPLIEDLDTLPIPDLSFLPLDKYKMRSRAKPVGSILTSRGCPYGCTFCNKNIFGNRFRARSPENVLQEIEYLVDKFQVRQIDFLDDNFNLDLNRAKRILQLIIQGYDHKLFLNFANGIKINNIDDEFIDLLKRAGTFKVGFGIESGDKQVLEKIRKNYDTESVIPIVRKLQKKNIVVYCNFMFGLPGDTPKTMRSTIELAKKISPDLANFTITLPFPGTELYNEIQTGGRFLIRTDQGVKLGFYGNQAFFEIGQTKAEDVQRFHKKAFLEFYGRLSQILRILKSIRSFNELLWILDASAALAGSIFKRSPRY